MMTQPETIPLSRNLKISRVVTGLWQIADMERANTKVDSHSAAREMQRYADSGLTTFDMADHYGSAEEIAGVFKESYTRQPVQLLTKWVPPPGKVSKADTRKAVEHALQKLQSDSIDLLQFHAWVYSNPYWLDCLFWLQELKEEGLVKNIGVTNFDTAHLRIAVASGVEIVSNQVCYSLLDHRASAGMTMYCQRNNIKLLAFGTLAGGFFSERWLNKPEPELNENLTWSQMKYKRYIDQAGGWKKLQELLGVLQQVANAHKVSLANVATRYILEQPTVAGVIVGARLGQSEHIDDTLKLFSFRLDPKSSEQIQRAIANLLPIPGDCGDEYRKPPYLTASGDLSHHVESFPKPFPTWQGSDGRTKALSGTVWEDMAGFSRAVRKGNRILISGTTATHENQAIGGSDPAAQTHFIIDKIEGALQSLGSSLEDVVRTRIFVRNTHDWEPVARAHGERFKTIQPANTLVRAEMIGEEYLVEMEAEAELAN